MSAGAGGGGGGGGNTSAAMTLANAVVAVQADTRALHQQLMAVQRHLAGLQSSVNSATDPSIAQGNLAQLQGGFSGMIQGILMNLQGGISSIIGMLTGGALLAAVSMATQSIVGMAAHIETATQSFEAMTGSAEDARDLIAEMNEFAAKTPYRVDEIQSAVKASMLYGFSAKEAMKQVQSLGDIASISGAQIDELTRLYAQMKSMGQYATVGSDFLGMMANRGIMSRKDIAKELGISEVALADRMSKGLLKWKQIEPIFQKLTMEGGRFYRGLERQSQTFAGLSSTLRDNITLIGNELGRVFLDGAKRLVSVGITVAGVIRGWAKSLADFNQKSGGMVARMATALAIAVGLVAVVPRLITGIRLLASVMNLSLASTGWGALVVALGGVVYLVMSVAGAMRKASGENGTLVKIGEAFVKLWDKAKVAFAKFGAAFMQGIEPLLQSFEKGIAKVVQFLDENMETITQIIEYSASVISSIVGAMSTGWIAQLNTIIQTLISIGDVLASVFDTDMGSMLSNQLKASLRLMEYFAALSLRTANIFAEIADKASFFFVQTADAIARTVAAFYHLAGGVVDAMRLILNSVGEAAGSFYGYFSRPLAETLNAFMKFSASIVNLIKSAFRLDFRGVVSSISALFASLGEMVKRFAQTVSGILRGAFTINVKSVLQGNARQFYSSMMGMADKVNDSFSNEGESVGRARKRAFRDDRDTRTFKEILADMRAERKYGATWGSGAKGVMESVFASDKVKKDERPEMNGGGMLMRAGFFGLDAAVKDMQQILLDEMKGDQQLGVLKDIRDVQKETLEIQKKGLAMGTGEQLAVMGS